MTNEDVHGRSIDDVVEFLLELGEHGQGLCPAGTDRAVWARDVLHELAHAVELLEGAVERVSGKHNAAVARNAHILATTINAHRNIAPNTRAGLVVGTRSAAG